jgi:nitrate reductase alpha subunit
MRLFFGFEEKNELLGMMRLQEKSEVSLIRHTYVKTTQRNSGDRLQTLASLDKVYRSTHFIGTWDSLSWAIRFYHVVSEAEKER